MGFKFKLRAFRFKLRHGFCFRARGRSVPWGSNFDDEVTHMVRMRSSCYGSWRSSPRLRSFGARVTWSRVVCSGHFPSLAGAPLRFIGAKRPSLGEGNASAAQLPTHGTIEMRGGTGSRL